MGIELTTLESRSIGRWVQIQPFWGGETSFKIAHRAQFFSSLGGFSAAAGRRV